MDEVVASVLGFIVRQTGRVVVWLISFGKWRGEQLTTDEASIYSPAGSLSFIRDGRRVITDTGLMFFGIAFYLLLIVILIASFA
ncbi:MAG: hypothetical protein WBK51_11675 [Polaromonas sp.]